MVGRMRNSDVKSRLGKRRSGITSKPGLRRSGTTSKPDLKRSDIRSKPGRIRDARDVLRNKSTLKGKISQTTTNVNTKARIRRLMPLADLLAKKTVTYDDSSKDKLRTLSLSGGSLRITAKQPELSRKSIISRNTLKVVTPSTTVSKQPSSSSDSVPTRTLTNDLYARGTGSPFLGAVEEDLRTSSPNLSFTRAIEDQPILRTSLGRPKQDTSDNKNLTKIVVTNLHPRVVQEDIAELFGAVGPLTSVRLEKGVAEVNFAKSVHADMAYHKYHNRMLDGQAMKCTLGLASAPASIDPSRENEQIRYSGAELVYPQTPSRPVVFQVRI